MLALIKEINQSSSRFQSLLMSHAYCTCCFVKGHLRRLGASDLAFGTKQANTVTVNSRARNKSFTSQLSSLQTQHVRAVCQRRGRKYKTKQRSGPRNCRANHQRAFNITFHKKKKTISQKDAPKCQYTGLYFFTKGHVQKLIPTCKLKNMIDIPPQQQPLWSCYGFCPSLKSPSLLRAISPLPSTFRSTLI